MFLFKISQTCTLKAECEIFCIDYSDSHVVLNNNIVNENLKDFLQKERPAESKVRWINVDGISWDVIKTLSIHYGMLL